MQRISPVYIMEDFYLFFLTSNTKERATLEEDQV